MPKRCRFYDIWAMPATTLASLLPYLSPAYQVWRGFIPMSQEQGPSPRPAARIDNVGTMWYPFCMKQHKGYRLSEEALRLLDALAAANGISRTAVLEMAIRTEAKKQGITVRADLRIQAESEQTPTRRD